MGEAALSIVVREPHVDEAPALTELVNEYSRRLYGEADLSVDEVRRWFALPNVWIGVVERDGALVGYFDVGDEDNGRMRFHLDSRPLEDEAADAAVRAAEGYARSRTRPGGIIRGYAPERDPVARGALERARFRAVRHSFEMRIELTFAPPVRSGARLPEWPDGIAVRAFRSEDEDAVWETINEAFEDHWDHQPPTAEGRAQWRQWSIEHPRFDPDLWFLVEDNSELAAVCLCGWHQSGDPTFGWVQTLGVRRPWRRRGLGLGLLRHSFQAFAERGAKRVGLGVDAENLTGAVRLYERAGMRVARRTDIYDKAL